MPSGLQVTMRQADVLLSRKLSHMVISELFEGQEWRWGVTVVALCYVVPSCVRGAASGAGWLCFLISSTSEWHHVTVNNGITTMWQWILSQCCFHSQAFICTFSLCIKMETVEIQIWKWKKCSYQWQKLAAPQPSLCGGLALSSFLSLRFRESTDRSLRHSAGMQATFQRMTDSLLWISAPPTWFSAFFVKTAFTDKLLWVIHLDLDRQHK